MEKRYLSPAEAVEAIVVNARRLEAQTPSRTILLSLLAGFYIAFGAQLATVATQDAAAHVGSGLARVAGGSVFSVGLMLVVICGAELFTGNTLLAKAALHGKIGWGKVASNWAVVITGNFAGSIVFAWLMYHSRLWESGNVADHAVGIASAKASLPFVAAFVRGVFCNWLVCLAVMMATAARDIPGKILACYVPIMTFVASGFEHSVANMYFIPTGLFLRDETGISASGLTWEGFFLGNLLPVTLGNIVGGVLFVSWAYWFIYLRHQKSA